MKKKVKEQKEEKRIIEIKEIVVFKFTYEENAKNVALALSLGGFYVKIGKSDGSYAVGIYSDRPFNY